ncbi:MAG: hypothetical protein VXU50_07285, partial [Verrucomicrobiota bacterium]|nr:hypothetical protein [Verrucomicrobiota bacterium]
QVSRGALFSCDFGEGIEWFFFACTAGGQTIPMDGLEVTVITAQSPVVGRLLGLKAGDYFKLPNSSLGQVLTVE